ncbi:MAG: hypothetical protein ACTHKE_09510 [Sphingomicrobium sp.]
MSKRMCLVVLSFGLSAWSVAASAGEVNGSTTNPKHYYSQGNSLCRFSGLNDNPDSTNPANPGGRTQNYGQENRLGLLDPSDPAQRDSFFFPGNGCNPVWVQQNGGPG